MLGLPPYINSRVSCYSTLSRSDDVAQGTGRNQVEPIPDDFTPEAILFHAADGGAIHIGDKVSVTGKLSVAPNVCFIKEFAIIDKAARYPIFTHGSLVEIDN
jgi:hypothetical protein